MITESINWRKYLNFEEFYPLIHWRVPRAHLRTHLSAVLLSFLLLFSEFHLDMYVFIELH